VTHSVCTLEFECTVLLRLDLENLDCREAATNTSRAPQSTYTVLRKRKLNAAGENGLVAGWDDPRMNTISGLRRAVSQARALRAFAKHGIT